MAERVDTVVVGAGQAGLATSYHLTRLGVEHVVLERGRVAQTWRTERWDGFMLNTPNWTLQLPGGEYDGDEPDAFMPRNGIVAYLEEGHIAEAELDVPAEQLERVPFPTGDPPRELDGVESVVWASG